MGPLSLPPPRVLLVDAVLAVALAAIVVLGSIQAAPHVPPYPNQPLDALAYGLIGISSGALVPRRIWPQATLVIMVAASAVYLAVTYPYGPFFLPMAVGVYTVAARLPVRRTVIVCAIAYAALLAGHVVGFRGTGLLAQLPLWLAAGTGWLVAPWAIGTVVGFRRDHIAREREDEARRRASEERLRIAREVHDVVGHGLAVINMQSGVALHVLNRRPEQARPALEAIKKASKESLDELRGTLAVFRQPERDPGSDAPTQPLPGLDQLDTLVTAMAQSGLSVRLNVTGESDHLPAATHLAAYRIVQESLTNVLRHAGTAAADVRVDHGPEEVVIEITDSGTAHAAESVGADGHGIAGMRERAVALGGTLEAGPRREGGFKVRACLPGESGS